MAKGAALRFHTSGTAKMAPWGHQHAVKLWMHPPMADAESHRQERRDKVTETHTQHSSEWRRETRTWPPTSTLSTHQFRPRDTTAESDLDSAMTSYAHHGREIRPAPAHLPPAHPPLLPPYQPSLRYPRLRKPRRMQTHRMTREFISSATSSLPSLKQ